MRYILAILLVIVATLWATIEFAAQFLAGSMWNMIPLLGMLIGLYSSVLLCKTLWLHRNNIRDFGHLIGNLITMADEADRTGRRNEFWEFLTLPPDEFRRRMQENLK